MVIIDSVWNEIKVDNTTNKNMDFFLMTQDPIFLWRDKHNSDQYNIYFRVKTNSYNKKKVFTLKYLLLCVFNFFFFLKLN